MVRFLNTRTPGNGRFFVPVGLLCVLCVGAGVGCSTATPEIAELRLQVVTRWVPGEASVEEHLSVAVDVRDADGENELESLVVSLSDALLEWRVPEADLAYRREGDRRWYVIEELGAPGLRRIPRGTYQISAIDFSGREVVRRQDLPSTVPSLTADDLPRMDEGTLVLPPGFRSMHIMVRLGEGQYRSTTVRAAAGPELLLDGGRIDLRELVAESGDAVLPALDPPPESVDLWLVAAWGESLRVETGPWRVSPRILTVPSQ